MLTIVVRSSSLPDGLLRTLRRPTLRSGLNLRCTWPSPQSPRLAGTPGSPLSLLNRELKNKADFGLKSATELPAAAGGTTHYSRRHLLGGASTPFKVSTSSHCWHFLQQPWDLIINPNRLNTPPTGSRPMGEGVGGEAATLLTSPKVGAAD